MINEVGVFSSTPLGVSSNPLWVGERGVSLLCVILVGTGSVEVGFPVTVLCMVDNEQPHARIFNFYQ